MHGLLKAAAAAVAVALILPAPAVAQDVVLMVHPDSVGSEAIALTMDDIRAMPATEIATTTPWTDGRQEFVGVAGDDLVRALGISAAEVVVAHAMNDYEVAIPYPVFAAATTLIAYSRNGSLMGVRDKGPLWVVFPYDADSVFASDVYLAYSIWSVDSVSFR